MRRGEEAFVRRAATCARYFEAVGGKTAGHLHDRADSTIKFVLFRANQSRRNKKTSTITVRVKRSARPKHTSGGVWTVFIFSGLELPVSTPTVFNVVLTVLIHYSQNLNRKVLAWFLTSILMCDVITRWQLLGSNWMTQFGCLTAHVMESRIPKAWVRGRQVKIQVHVY